MSSQALLEQLKQGIVALGDDPDKYPLELYLGYLNELVRWNKAYNLTAISDVEKMITYHILDSLSVLPYLNGTRCLDVGTGAGLPGIVLAIARPEMQWVLLDSKTKKVRFLHHIIQVLRPANVEIIHSRVEDYYPQQLFSTIISRAFSSLSNFYQITKHLAHESTHTLAMKGKTAEKELSDSGFGDCKIHKLLVPGVDSDRYIIIK
ncbi:MAG: 16S rRNA (guanine(527)-N(7))-methyltransferase RsmG [Gammaproteobacteria bacterium]